VPEDLVLLTEPNARAAVQRLKTREAIAGFGPIDDDGEDLPLPACEIWEMA
jgi:hypothetical protein